MAKCRECKTGKLKIIGSGMYGDCVEVECQNPECNENYDVEPDGLGMAGMEWVMAKMADEGFDEGFDE